MDVDLFSVILEPSSTIDGVSYFYTNTFNVGGDGNVLSDAYTAYSEAEHQTAGVTDNALTSNPAHKLYFDRDFQTNYGTDLANDTVDNTNAMFGYVDYVFQLKANNTSGSTKYINMKNVSLTYGGNDDDAMKAFRMAVFAEDYDTSSAFTGDAAVSNLKTILSNGRVAADYFDDGKAVDSASSRNSVTSFNEPATIATITNGTTKYYKVIVRFWLEGEDENCNNSVFNTLADKWALSLNIEMNDASTTTANALVNTITATKTATKVDLTVGTANGSGTKVIDGTTYYQIGTTSYYKTTTTALANTDIIYTIADGKHPVDVTNTINFVTS
jgi:hypothetical protein